MLKDTAGQFEMFGDDFSEKSLRRGQEKGGDRLRLKIQACQRTIFVFIVFILAAIISFSLGVERGKKIIARKGVYSTPIDRPVPQGQPIPKPPETTINLPYQKELVSAKEGKKGAINVKEKRDLTTIGYTIQVASILQTKNIEKTLARLNKKGHSAFSLSKGKYAVICVGKFSLKEDAQSYLQKLKANYPDCLIRRL